MENLKTLSLVCLLLLAGCHRKNGDGSPVGVGALPGMCAASEPKRYTGAVVEGYCPPTMPNCQTPIQTVQVQANVIDFERDRIDVKLYYPDGTYRTIPCQNISLGRGVVLIVAGKEAGYTSYTIDEQLCR